MKLTPMNYKGSYQPKHTNKHMSQERKAELRGAVLRRLLLINIALYVLGVLSAAGGNPTFLLLPVFMTVMLGIWAVSEYLGDSWEDGMISAARAESADHSSERESRRELRRRGQDPDKVAQRLERGDAAHIAADGEIVFEDKHVHSPNHK